MNVIRVILVLLQFCFFKTLNAVVDSCVVFFYNNIFCVFFFSYIIFFHVYHLFYYSHAYTCYIIIYVFIVYKPFYMLHTPPTHSHQNKQKVHYQNNSHTPEQKSDTPPGTKRKCWFNFRVWFLIFFFFSLEICICGVEVCFKCNVFSADIGSMCV